MGQKVHPFAFRLPIIRNWTSNWFANRKSDYEKHVQEDIKLRKYIKTKMPDAGIASVDIQRDNQAIVVIIRTAKPGIIIGKSGASIDTLREQLRKLMNCPVDVKVFEVRKVNINAALVAQKVGNQIERRVAYRRAIKGAIQEAMQDGALGIKVNIGGRLNGSDIARRENYKEGNIPLHTLRADIDYAVYHAQTTFGIIGIKVWIYKGLVFDGQLSQDHDQEVKGGLGASKKADMTPNNADTLAA
ncbi:30S ribosomal protein S3 [Candidatus Gracilibacteria bacterium]|nr:30S ribosomal protein S3 [Candidatus Gracilibacteria bacterium]